MTNHLSDRVWSQDELINLRNRMEFALKEFRRSGIEIDASSLNKIEQAELKAYVNALPDSALSTDQLKGLTDRLSIVDKDNDTLSV